MRLCFANQNVHVYLQTGNKIVFFIKVTTQKGEHSCTKRESTHVQCFKRVSNNKREYHGKLFLKHTSIENTLDKSVTGWMVQYAG
mgnify:FL=1